MLNVFKRNKIVFIFVFIIILLTPFSLETRAETDKVSVVTSVGIDRVKEGVEVSANVIVPNSGGSGGAGGTDGTVKTVTAIGNNISTAFSNLTLIIGKTPGLAHCDAIILNKNLFETSVLEYLDFFIRTNNLTSNATLIVAENTAREIVETTASQKGLRAVSLSDVLLLNNEYALTKKANIDAFYLEHFSPSACSVLPLLTVGDSNKENVEVGNKGAEKIKSNTVPTKTENESLGSSGSGGNGEKLGQSGNGSPTKIIKNEGKGVVVKNGKIIKVVSGAEMSGINLVSKNTKKGHLQIKNITAKQFENADLSFKIFNKKTKVNGYFLNGVPVFNYNLDLVLKLEEVNSENFKVDMLKTTENYVEGTIKNEIAKKVNFDLAAIINTAKQNKVDILGVHDYFYKMFNKQWLNFVDSLPDKTDYLNYVIFTVDLKTQGKI